MAVKDHLCLPIKIDAFVLNEAACDSGLVRVAPITQPDYVSLRLTNAYIQHDILPPIDLHNSQPAHANPRVSSTFESSFENLNRLDPTGPSDDANGYVKRERLGVHLSFVLPRGYRSATSRAQNPVAPSDVPGLDPQTPGNQSDASPVYPLVPNRWLLIRTIRSCDKTTIAAEPCTAWIIESDRLRSIDDLPLKDDFGQDFDIERQVAPFVRYPKDGKTQSGLLNSQAEQYIGYRVPLDKWSEDVSAARVNLTAMNSSNPMFVDCAMHNANVFSTFDNLCYGQDANGTPLYLENAVCDYTVVGWHSNAIGDPLVASSDDAAATLLARLSKMFCAPPTTSNPDLNASLADFRLLCHGACYGVNFGHQKPTSSAEDYAKYFQPGSLPNMDRDMEPVAVGNSPLDAVLAFFQAHDGDTNGFEPAVLCDQGGAIATKLMHLRELLFATEDDYDSRIKAADLISSQSFRRSPGGSTWHYDRIKNKDGPPAQPSAPEGDLLTNLNALQSNLDAADRQLAQLGWALFAEFFKHVSDPSLLTDSRKAMYTSRVQALSTEATSLKSWRDGIVAVAIKDCLATQVPQDPATPSLAEVSFSQHVKKVASEPFFKRSDPTLTIAGLDSGWDPEYLTTSVQTRFEAQIAPPTTSTDPNVIASNARVQASLQKVVLSDMQALGDVSSTVTALLKESSGGCPPDMLKLGHMSWTGQPFCPQSIEWEGVYYHIDKTKWSMALAPKALPSSNHEHIQYSIPKPLDQIPDLQDDVRSVSGRILVLPQPSFALGAVVDQVLGATPANQLPDELKDPATHADFVKSVQNLKFISGEMTGLSDSLLTMAVGQHVKPNVRVQGRNPEPMQDAVNAGTQINLSNEDFVTMGAETGKIPFGTLVDFGTLDAKGIMPFKGVQHGQLAITKLTVVDKFGQAISCPQPQRALRNPIVGSIPEFVHPCISENLVPSKMQVLTSDPTGEQYALNTVFTTQQTQDRILESGTMMTPFIQLTPAINQEARLNFKFLESKVDVDGIAQPWSICSDWDSPIFGWVVVNYADSALQFFTADGIFYTSMSFGGPTGTIEAQPWLPFQPPDKLDKAPLVSPQLQSLINEMTKSGTQGQTYLLALWSLIEQAIESMPFAPSAYASNVNAVVGKPLALVNVGLSLELAQSPLWSQHTLPQPKSNPDYTKGIPDPVRTTAAQDLTSYEFPVKIGDCERLFDGVVAYWDSGTAGELAATTWEKIYTYYPNDKTSVATAATTTAASGTASKLTDGPVTTSAFRTAIDPTSFPVLSPYFVDPDVKSDSSSYAAAQMAHMTVKTMLIDPYTSLHVYSSILPIKSLQLPSWTLQQATKNMTAFFAMGPLLIPSDVPKLYDTLQPLEPDTWLKDSDATKASTQPDPITLPIAGTKGLWKWLQPYSVDEKGQTQGSLTADTSQGAKYSTKYNQLSIGQDDGKLRLQSAPYSFVEGFLQLARPLVSTEGYPVPPKTETT